MPDYPVRVNGIPAIARVTRLEYQPGIGRTPAQDPDDFGGWVVEYDLLDRRGYRARWLEAKGVDVTDQIIRQI